MANKTLDRRTVLKGVLATGATVSIPLPLLEIMLNGNGTAYAQTGDAGLAAVRHVVLRRRHAAGPLEAGEDRDRARTGLSARSSSVVRREVLSDGDQRADEQAGRRWPRAPDRLCRSDHRRALERKRRDARRRSTRSSPSLISAGAPFNSIEVGRHAGDTQRRRDSLATVSHRGPNAKNVADYDPKSVFNRLFTGTARPRTDAGPGHEAGQRSQERARRRVGRRRGLQKRLGRPTSSASSSTSRRFAASKRGS